MEEIEVQNLLFCLYHSSTVFVEIADLELAVADSRYRHEYKDNKLSVPKPNY